MKGHVPLIANVKAFALFAVEASFAILRLPPHRFLNIDFRNIGPVYRWFNRNFICSHVPVLGLPQA
jgi:hypothetical protein